MKNLSFSDDGICRISFVGFPNPDEVVELVEEYVASVELLSKPLKLVFFDISRLVHMELRTRRIFSELLMQASKHYQGKVELVVAGGSLNLRRFIQLFCRGIGFADRSHIFPDLSEADYWVKNWSRRVMQPEEKISRTTGDLE